MFIVNFRNIHRYVINYASRLGVCFSGGVFVIVCIKEIYWYRYTLVTVSTLCSFRKGEIFYPSNLIGRTYIHLI